MLLANACAALGHLRQSAHRTLLGAITALAAVVQVHAAPPADENFAGYVQDGVTVALPRTLGGFVYDGNGGTLHR
ncbi:MAG TPA: hypothetical protein PLN52_23715 [Opitutaceae bacterium]|nr:hypothetical protein [Opitutaceae bacterium]